MTLLEELIEGASGRNVDLPTLLRRFKVLAARLGNKPAEDWLEWELDGYPASVPVPAYRQLPMQLQGDFLGPFRRADNFIIPPGLVPAEVRGSAPLDRIDYRQSVSAIEHLLENAKAFVTVPMGDLALHLDNVLTGMQCTGVWGRVGTGNLVEVVNTVRNRLLNISLALWKEMPDAGALSVRATPEVQTKAAQIITYHIYGSANVVGTANHSSVVLNVTKGDLTSLQHALAENGVSSRDVTALKRALEAEPTATGRTWGPKVTEWFVAMMKKAADGTWKISTSVAGSVLTAALKKYYGLE